MSWLQLHRGVRDPRTCSHYISPRLLQLTVPSQGARRLISFMTDGKWLRRGSMRNAIVERRGWHLGLRELPGFIGLAILLVRGTRLSISGVLESRRGCVEYPQWGRP